MPKHLISSWKSSVIVGIATVAMPVCRRPREAPEATDKGGSITAASGDGMENMRFPAQSLRGRLLRKLAETPKILASRNRTRRFASSRRESWLPAPLPPPLSLCKLTTLPDQRRNSFWFQRGLTTPCELLRLRLRRKSVSECPQSHYDRTSTESVRIEKSSSFQSVKNPA